MKRNRTRIQFPGGVKSTTGYFLLTIILLVPSLMSSSVYLHASRGYSTNVLISLAINQIGATLSATETTTPTETVTQTITPPPTETMTSIAINSSTWTPTRTDTPTQTATITKTPTNTPSREATSSPTSAQIPALTILINEIAWAGTIASSSDEWIELFNPTSRLVDLENWRLVASDGSPDISLTGHIAPGEYFILERSDDSTIADITASLIYTGALGNGGETLHLLGPSGELVDSANASGIAWPAGDSSTHASMERIGITPDHPAAWGTHNRTMSNGIDQAGHPILGTPKKMNSVVFTPTETPAITLTPSITPSLISTRVPELSIIISEVAWAGTSANANDEWLELYNPGNQPMQINGWKLTSADGSPDVELTGFLHPGGFFLLERSDDSTVDNIPADMIYTGALSNHGETLFLLGPSGELVDSANFSGGDWPAGNAMLRISMERFANTHDSAGAWRANTGEYINGEDQGGNPIRGTPRNPNSVWFQNTPSPTVSNTLPATVTPTILPDIPQVLFINEVSWSGTLASSSDEWIELNNPGGIPINLSGWRLVSTDGSPSILLQGIIDPGGYFLLERSPDDTVLDILADQIYAGSLRNSGETLLLINPYNEVIDSANLDGGNWPAGLVSERASMERVPGRQDSDSAWRTNTGYVVNGYAADGTLIRGTPRKANSILWPVPTPTPLPEGVRINEFLPHPKFDWNGDGQINTADEFIEVINFSGGSVNLSGWMLDDIEGGSSVYILPSIILSSGETRAFFSSETGLSLSDRGDSVRLIAPNGAIIDERIYNFAHEINLTWCRVPDGYGLLMYPCWPTPHQLNFHFPHPRDRPAGMPVSNENHTSDRYRLFWDSVIYTNLKVVYVCFFHYHGYPLGWLCLL